MFQRGAWLGQIPLVLGPSSWGAGMVPIRPVFDAEPSAWGPAEGTPPYYVQWGVYGVSGKSGTIGPFNTIDEAFNAAAKAAPMDGFTQIVDSKGQSVGPTT